MPTDPHVSELRKASLRIAAAAILILAVSSPAEASRIRKPHMPKIPKVHAPHLPKLPHLSARIGG